MYPYGKLFGGQIWFWMRWCAAVSNGIQQVQAWFPGPAIESSPGKLNPIGSLLWETLEFREQDKQATEGTARAEVQEQESMWNFQGGAEFSLHWCVCVGGVGGGALVGRVGVWKGWRESAFEGFNVSG